MLKLMMYILIFALTILSCNSYISLDEKNKKSLIFDSLPLKVQETYLQNLEPTSETTEKVINLDKYKLEFIRGGEDKSYIEQIRDNNYHFIIENKKFKMRGNQGDPFVFYNKSFYYTSELNLDKYNFKKVKYYKIDLSGDIQ